MGRSWDNKHKHYFYYGIEIIFKIVYTEVQLKYIVDIYRLIS